VAVPRPEKNEPDIWIQDENHAIIIENKDGGPRSEREADYVKFLHESALNRPKKAFLYAVPEAWLPSRAQSEWWKFVREKPANDEVRRGIIPWHSDFVKFLCRVLSVPRWFRDKLPDRVDEGKYLDPGKHFWQAPETRIGL
jgi:hypothetical protein